MPWNHRLGSMQLLTKNIFQKATQFLPVMDMYTPLEPSHPHPKYQQFPASKDKGTESQKRSAEERNMHPDFQPKQNAMGPKPKNILGLDGVQHPKFSQLVSF